MALRGLPMWAAWWASTTVRLLQISTNVFRAPIHSTRCTSCGSGQWNGEWLGVPLRRMTYTPIMAVKNMISVTRKSHMASLPLGKGNPMWACCGSSCTA